MYVCVGQISFYDQFKYLLMKTGFFADNIVTHFSASFLAVSLILCYYMFSSRYDSCLLFCAVCEVFTVIQLVM